MALGFVDRCVFTAASAGTGNFVVSAAVTGYLTPAQASAVTGTTYRYFAQSDDLSEWEVGYGAYTSATTTLARTTIEFSSNSNNAVNFTAAPKVYMGGPLARDMHWEVIGDTTVSSPVASVEHTIDLSKYAEIKVQVINLTNAASGGGVEMDWGWQLQQSDGTVDYDAAAFIPVQTVNGSATVLRGFIVGNYSASASCPVSSMYDFCSNAGSSPGGNFDHSAPLNLSATTKIVFFYSDVNSSNNVATASNTTGGRIVTYGLRLP